METGVTLFLEEKFQRRPEAEGGKFTPIPFADPRSISFKVTTKHKIHSVLKHTKYSKFYRGDECKQNHS